MHKTTKAHRRQVQIQVGREVDEKKEAARRYSKLAPLVITSGVSPDPQQKYVVTHLSSGLAITSLPKLSIARQALTLLLPLTDWSQPYTALQYDADLLLRCRQAVAPLGATVTKRK